MASPLMDMTLERLVDHAAHAAPGDDVHAEFARRQTILQEQVRDAAKDTAEYIKRNARYMLWSDIVLAASAVVSALVSIFLAFTHHG